MRAGVGVDDQQVHRVGADVQHTQPHASNLQAYCHDCGAVQASYREQGPMADKSPRQSMSKKAGKSLKEKRADKHAKSDAKNNQHIEIVPGKKH
ncbi:hypothetical protein GCM10023145_11050 [Angustibacter luteus]